MSVHLLVETKKREPNTQSPTKLLTNFAHHEKQKKKIQTLSVKMATRQKCDKTHQFCNEQTIGPNISFCRITVIVEQKEQQKNVRLLPTIAGTSFPHS